jgi:hypothetical protein
MRRIAVCVAVALATGCDAPLETDCAEADVRAESRESTCEPDIRTEALDCSLVWSRDSNGCDFYEERVCTSGITKTTFISYDPSRPVSGTVTFHDVERSCRVVFELAEAD